MIVPPNASFQRRCWPACELAQLTARHDWQKSRPAQRPRQRRPLQSNVGRLRSVIGIQNAMLGIIRSKEWPEYIALFFASLLSRSNQHILRYSWCLYDWKMTSIHCAILGDIVIIEIYHIFFIVFTIEEWPAYIALFLVSSRLNDDWNTLHYSWWYCYYWNIPHFLYRLHYWRMTSIHCVLGIFTIERWLEYIALFLVLLLVLKYTTLSLPSSLLKNNQNTLRCSW